MNTFVERVLDAAVADRRSLVIQQKKDLDALRVKHGIQRLAANSYVNKAKRVCGSVAAAESVNKAEAAAERAAKADAKAAGTPKE